MTSKRYQIQQKLKPLYEIRTRIGTQFRKAKEANDTDTIEIWERVWKVVANEIVALHDEADLMKIAKTGVVNKKTASRKISRVTKKINNSKKK